MTKTTPKRIQLSRKTGFKLPPKTVSVARPSKWGNPFIVTPERTNVTCVWAFETWLKDESGHAGIPEKKKWILYNIESLRGKNLACWCKPEEVCHADVLLKMSNK